MEWLSLDSIVTILGILFGGGSGAFFTWRWMKKKAKAEAESAEVDMEQKVQDTYQQMLKDKDEEVQDKNRIINELREDRDHFRQDRNDLRERLEKTEETVRELQRLVARNGRQLEAMRPFQCFDLKCKKRQRVPISECEETKKQEIEPNNEL